MAVRVLIEREIEAGQEAKLKGLLMQLRAKAMTMKGYISGETLRALNNPDRFLVISTWNDVNDWKVWENDPARKALQEELNKILRLPEARAIYSNL